MRTGEERATQTHDNSRQTDDSCDADRVGTSTTPRFGPFLAAFIDSIMPVTLRRFMGASDLVQSVLVRAIRNQDLLQHLTDEQYRAWLVQVARRRIIDGLRHFRLTAVPDGESRCLLAPYDAQLQVFSEEMNPTELLELQEQADLLLASIKQLPEDVQQVMAMRYAKEMSFQQISEMTGWPVTTCRRKWRKGCDLLRHRLKPLLDDCSTSTAGQSKFR